MANMQFSKRLQTKINENLGIMAFAPEEEQPAQPEQAQIPSSSQVNVTSGETTTMGEPREDLEAQKTGGGNDNEAFGEVASLLITIGYILSQKRLVTDKFNTVDVIKYLNDKFSSPTAAGVPTPEVDKIRDDDVDMPAYVEGRKLLESKFRDKKNAV